MHIKEFLTQMDAVLKATTPTLELYYELMRRTPHKGAREMSEARLRERIINLVADDCTSEAADLFLWGSICASVDDTCHWYWRTLFC